MAINYTYPVKAVPTVSDNVLIIDNEDTTNPRATKTATIQSIVNLASGGGGGTTWGSITGTLSTQTDLQSALDAKQDTLTLTTTGTSGAATLVGSTLNIPEYAGGGGGVTSVTGTSPVVSSGGTTPDISMAAATTSVNGYLTSTDWTTFNNKLTSVSGDPLPVLSGNLDVNTNSIVSNGGQDIKITPDAAGNVVLDGIKYPQADGTGGQVLQTNGAGQLSFATVGGSGTVTEVTTNAPLSVTNGTTTPDLTITQATTSVDGYLTSTDWNTFNNKLSSVSGDALPVLSGNLDVNGNSIVSGAGGNISITPDTTGSVILDGISYPQADGTIDQVLKTDGAGQLSFATVGGGIAAVVDDTTPQLGGDLDLNTYDITGTGDINITGTVTSDDFIGDLNGAVRFEAKNESGATLLKGKVVSITGVSGEVALVDLADADDATARPAFGLVYADSNNNAACEVVTLGNLTGLNTSAFSEGDTLYVSTSPGELTDTPPSGELAAIQNIGRVIRSHPSAGIIRVGGAGRANATPNLDSAKMFLGNASNQAASVAMSGDVTIDNTGVTTVATINSVAVATVTAGAALGATALPLAGGAMTGAITGNQDITGKRPIVTDTTATIDLTLGTHEGTFIYSDSALAVTVNILLNTAQAFPVGTEIDIIQAGAGVVTITPALGVNLNGANTAIPITAQWGGATLKQITVNNWIIVGKI